MKRIIVSLMAGALALGTATAAFAEGEIQQRKENQQQRIGEGVENGSLTPHETGKLERRESALNHEIRADRKANGGNLTNNEKAKINRQQNHLSKSIHHQKHDGQHQAK
jgi:hypothetical protein